jgi:osmotically-inducible protein OsmY
MADRNRYSRRGRYQDWNERDDRSWRDQEEQFSNERGSQPDYEEGYGTQMSEPYGGSYGQRPSDYETAWDRDSRYGQGGTGYSRGAGSQSRGQYNYGPARFDSGTSWRGGSFTGEDFGGRDFNARTGRDLGGYGGFGGYSGSGLYEGTGAYRAGYGTGYAGSGGYGSSRGYGGRGDDRNRRDWFDRAGDEVMSWFGDEDAARRRRMDHSGRGPQNYTRSDDRIREDVNDNLTEDWGVDASNVTVTVSNGEVTLDGTVATRLQKRRAEDCAEDVSGVKNVQNNLRVQERSTWDRSDTETSATSTSTSTTG